MESHTSNLKNNAKPDMEKLCQKHIVDADRYALYRKRSSSTIEIAQYQPYIYTQLQIIKTNEEKLTKLLSVQPPVDKYLITQKKIIVLGTKALFCKTKGANYDLCIKRASEDVRILLRPSIEQFIDIMSCFYDIVVFSDFSFEITSQVIAAIDKKKAIKKIYDKSDAIVLSQKRIIKDLRIITSKLCNIVIIDCHLLYFALQPENGILISKFKGNKFDHELKDIGEVLIAIADVADIRTVLREKYKYIDLI